MSTGDDNHSDNAVRLMQDLLKNTNIPCYVVDSEYGAYQRHCFTENAREDLLIGAFTYSSARFPQSGSTDGKVCSSGRGYEELEILK